MVLLLIRPKYAVDDNIAIKTENKVLEENKKIRKNIRKNVCEKDVEKTICEKKPLYPVGTR